MNMDINFSGKTALVTGAGKGIGRAIAKVLAQCGANVIALTRTQSDLDSLKEEIPNLRTICVDLMNMDEALKAVEEEGTIDYLVNNAAHIVSKSCLEITREDYENSMLVCVIAPVHLMQLVAGKLIKEEKGGAIVNISTMGSSLGHLRSLPYASVKAALESATRCFAVELTRHKIRVNCLRPGAINTLKAQQLIDSGFAEVMQAIVDRTPQQRMGEPEEIAHTVAYLLSDKASFITGQCVLADGGFTVN